MNKFAKLLSESVRKHNITYRKAAKWAGVSPDLLSRIVLGNRLPSPKSALKISKALGIDHEEALTALNYDKVPRGAKKYFVPPKAKYRELREFLKVRSEKSGSTHRKIFSEIDQFSYGSMEILLLSRVLYGMERYYAELSEEQIKKTESDRNRKYLSKILKNITLEIDDEKRLLDILSPLMKWEAVPPEYSVKLTLSRPQGQKLTISTGKTTYDASVITFTNSEPVEVPLMEDRIAAGFPLPISGNWNETRFFTSSFIRKFQNPILIEVGKDQDSMIPKIFPGDLLLIDRRPIAKPKRRKIYAVNLDDGGSIKYCHVDAGKLHITCENKYAEFTPIKMELSEQVINEIIVGEIVWIGRELNR